MMTPVAEAALEVLAAGTEFPGLRRALFAAVAGRHLTAGTASLQVGVAEGEGSLPLEVLLERLPTRPLATVATINKGRTGIKDALPGPYPLVVTAEERGSSDHFDFEGPGVMIPMVSSTGHGDASLKRVHFQDGQYAVGSILSVVQPRDPEQLSARYLHAYLGSFKDELLVSRMVGTANVSLTVAKIGEVPVPLLPIDAQRKVDELMALCDRLETRQQDAAAVHARLVQALLDSLTQARDAEEFQACWQRVAEQFAVAFGTDEAVAALAKVVISLAMRGRLAASVDTIQLDGEPLSTRDHWIARRDAIQAVPVFDSFADLDTARESRGVTLGLVRPARLLGLDITPVENPDWTDDEKTKLLQEQQQGSLFDAVEDQRSLKTLKKLPFDFHYRYACETATGTTEHRHKLVDWEAGALYWNVHRRPDWQAAFRQKFVTEFGDKDVLFLMGTIHRFPKQWLIVSVLYPPKLPDVLARQQPLF